MRCSLRKKKFAQLIMIILFIIIFSMIFLQRDDNLSRKQLLNQSFANSYNSSLDNTTIDSPSLVIICLPYPVSNIKKRNRYLISMSSWLQTSPTTKIMILMPPYEFDPDLILLPTLESLFGQGRILFGPSLETDENGVPFIDEWFIKGLDAVRTIPAQLACWINADIITPQGWLPRILYLYDYFIKNNDQQIAVISKRCDFDIDDVRAAQVYEQISTKQNFPPDYDQIAFNRVLHSTWGIDFFLISTEPMQINFDEIPPFHLGKYRWDPWITGWLRKNMPLITLGDDFCTYHLNHRPKRRQMEDIKVKENFEAARRNHNYNVANGMASYQLRGRYLYKKDEKEPLDKIYDSIPLSNAPSK